MKTQVVDRGASLCGDVASMLGKHRQPNTRSPSYDGATPNRRAYGVAVPVARQGRRLIRYVAVASASAQNVKGAALEISIVRMQSLTVRRILSDFPFCWDVYGQERRRWVPREDRSRRMV